MRTRTLIKTHAVLAYYVLTFAISWGGVLILGAPYGMPTTSGQFEKLWPVVLLPYFLGPSIAGLLLTGLVHGTPGLRELLSRLLTWRVGAHWYGIALLTAPLLVIATLLALSLTSPVFLPDILTTGNAVGLLLSGIVVGLVFGGFLEELGWTGFAVPALRQGQSVLATGLIAGLLHAVWHVLPTFWGSGDDSGALSLLLFLPPCVFYAGALPAYRVLMVWVYDRTDGSLLLAMLMHASLTANTLFILSPLARGISLMIYYLILTGVLWTFVAAVALANRGQLSRHPPGEHREESRAEVQTHPRITVRRRRWQRIVLLSVLGYEGAGALLGGSLLVAAPDGHLMDMPVDIMHGFFSDFLIPGLILIGLGILNTIAFVAVWRQSWIDWLLAGLAVGGLAVWFIVEIAILRELHWLHAMWGLPVLAGCFVALPLVPSRQATRHGS